jgi:hypothetical protein
VAGNHGSRFVWVGGGGGGVDSGVWGLGGSFLKLHHTGRPFASNDPPASVAVASLLSYLSLWFGGDQLPGRPVVFSWVGARLGQARGWWQAQGTVGGELGVLAPLATSCICCPHVHPPCCRYPIHINQPCLALVLSRSLHFAASSQWVCTAPLGCHRESGEGRGFFGRVWRASASVSRFVRPDPALTPAKSAPIPAIGLRGCIMLSEGCWK